MLAARTAINADRNMQYGTGALQRAILAMFVAIPGCASRPDTPPPAEAGAHDHAAMAELPASPGPGYTVADVRFMQNMIGHHAQAITMAAMAPSGGASDHVLRLAQKIDISQRDEIVMMKAWLGERKQAV